MLLQYQVLNDYLTITSTSTLINGSNIPNQDTHNTLLLQNQSDTVSVYFTNADGNKTGIKIAPGQIFPYPLEFGKTEKIYLKTLNGSAVVAYMAW